MARNGDHGVSVLRVALVTGSAALRLHLRALLGEVPQARYAFTAYSIDDLRGFRPPADIYLLDGETLGGRNDEEWLSELLPGQAGVVWLLGGGTHPSWPEADRGAAFLSSQIDSADLSAALPAVAAGYHVWDPRVEDGSAGDAPVHPASNTAPPTDTAIHLTEREREVIELLAAGYGNSTIAHVLDLSVNTVKFHLKSLYEKLEVSSRTGAIREAARHGLLIL